MLADISTVQRGPARLIEARDELPSGTVTLLFTDIEGSTMLLQRLGQRYAGLLQVHRNLLAAAFRDHGGQEVGSWGDSLFAVFRQARAAVAGAAAAQRALAEHPWPPDGAVRVRMGLHTGEPTLTAGGYLGLDVHRTARLCAAGHGAQVLLSRTTHDLVEHQLPPSLSLRNLGQHHLKNLAHHEQVFQLVDAARPADFPPLRATRTGPNSLPIQATPLVGREPDLAAARDQLLRPEVGLLTLVGPGGAGKTRLALQLAANCLDAFPDGVFFVPLAAIRDPALVAPSIARALRAPEAPCRPRPDSLAAYLRDKRLLLLLDNFEQVLSAGPVLAALLASCPGLKMLVTSRAVLHLSGAHTLAVPPLDLPERGGLPPLERLARYGAVRLFVDRARAASPDFALTTQNAPAIAEICHRIDGLPLAIELAAAKTRLLPPPAMLARSARRLPLLTDGPRDRPARQQSLRDTLTWSYELLDEPEQRLLRRLAVFAASWSLEAAETVCSADDEPPGAVLDGVAALVDASLLRREKDFDDAPRFGMFETVQEYALERLEASGEAASIRDRHAAYDRALAEPTRLKGD